MPRNSSKWVLTALGAAMAIAGAVAMLRGWDQVQLERGWSLFIAGSVLLSGGFIVVAAAAVIARLDQLIAQGRASTTEASFESSEPLHASVGAAHASLPAMAEEIAAPPSSPAPPEFAPQEPPAPMPEFATAPDPAATAEVVSEVAAAAAKFAGDMAPRFAPRSRFKGAAPPPEPDEPRKVDTYRSGELTYVMFSDGSVEVQAPSGAQRYASLAELREHMLQQS